MTDDHQTPPPAYAAAPAHQSNGMAIASLVLGILALLMSLIPFIGVIAWILAPLGLIFGFIAIGKPSGKGMAIGGLITSGLGLLICIGWVTFLSAVVSQAQREGVFENMPTSSANIDTNGDTTTITTPESTTTVTTTPNDGAAPAGDDTGGQDGSGDAGASSHSGDAPPSN